MRNWFFYFAGLLFVLPCLAQDGSTGAIRGVVLDPVHRRVAGATVALVNNATGFRYQQFADSESGQPAERIHRHGL